MDAFSLLSVQNVMKVVDAVQDIRLNTARIVFLKRLNLVPALDNEILAKYTGRILVADIIADGQAAPVRASQPVQTVQTTIPTLKHGEVVDQRTLNALDAIQRGVNSGRDLNIFEDYLARRGPQIVLGTLLRAETLAAAMMIDSFSYNRLGVQITGSWGMPADLKVTPGTLWSDVNATPITDIWTQKRIGREKYGVEYDRLDISTTAFLYMVQTTQFKNMAQTSLAIALNASGFNFGNIDFMKGMAQNLLGLKEINIDDRQFWVENSDASQSSSNVLTANKALLSSTNLDNDDNAADFANGVVQETRAGTVPNMIGGFGGVQEGPVGYVTGADPNGNPPGLIMWGVMRGFPRRHFDALTSVITTH